MDGNVTLGEPIELKCYLCDHELVSHVSHNEGGMVFVMICPIHGTRGTNEIFNPNRTRSCETCS